MTWRFDWELVRAALRPKAFVLSDQKADLRWLQDHTLRSSAGLAQAAMVDDAGSSISSAAISLRNWLAELNSKDRASWLWEATDRLTSVLCLRADVRVIDDVDVPLLLVPRPNTIYAPFWHRWDGLNDRLAFGTPDVMRVYLRSFESLLEYSQGARNTQVATNQTAQHSFWVWIGLLSVHIALLSQAAVRKLPSVARAASRYRFQIRASARTARSRHWQGRYLRQVPG